MKVVILAGGLGTRISEETINKPKPMIKIGNLPVIHHIMNYFSKFGFNEFIICAGYKSEIIKDYFVNLDVMQNDLNSDYKEKKFHILKKKENNWKIIISDTGLDAETGGRLLAVKKYLKHEKSFFFTYGDGLSNVNLKSLVAFHKKHKKMATVTGVHMPKPRFGSLAFDKNDNVNSFQEKPKDIKNWINGGYFVLNNSVFDHLKSKKDIWEREPLQNIVKKKQLKVFKHKGFWFPMDTLSDKNYLTNLFLSKKAPWY